nr:PQQ-dependent sugar dehydrogenase [Microcystis viridis]
MNDDGSLPKDNPFAGSKIWSYGHRNIQGISFDPMTKRVWATEHGAQGGDELNLIEKGKNYGWPVVSAIRH